MCHVLKISVLASALLAASLVSAGTYPSINVTDAPYNAIPNDGIDDTVAFQNALNAASGGRGHVVAPAGVFDFTGTLQIPLHVTLEGQLDNPSDWPACGALCPPNPWRSTTLRITQTGSTLANPFIFMQVDSSVRGVAIFHKDQNRSMAPVVYPPAIRGSEFCSVEDVLLVNPYKGIDFATVNGTRHVIRNVYGQPLFIGIEIDQCYDIGRIENVHFGPFWDAYDPDVAGGPEEFMARYGTAILMHRSDWEVVDGVYTYGYHLGLQFVDVGNGVTNGQFANLTFKQADVGVDIYGASQVAGVHISNLDIEIAAPAWFTNKRPIWSHPGYDSWVDVRGASFSGASPAGDVVWESGHLIVSNSNFDSWGAGGPAINITGGTTMVRGNSFKSGGGNGQAVVVAANAGNVMINDNQLNGNTIVNNNGGQTFILGNQ